MQAPQWEAPSRLFDLQVLVADPANQEMEPCIYKVGLRFLRSIVINAKP